MQRLCGKFSDYVTFDTYYVPVQEHNSRCAAREMKMSGVPVVGGSHLVANLGQLLL